MTPSGPCKGPPTEGTSLMVCLACGASAVWLLDSAPAGIDMVNGACGEHVNKVLRALAHEVLVTRVPAAGGR